MSTVIYSYSSNSFSHSTLLSVNPINGQLEHLNYRTPDYRNHESQSLTKWGTLSNLSIDGLPSIVDDNIDSGLGTSEEFSDSESTPDLFNTGFCEESDELSEYSDVDISSQLNIAFCEKSDDFFDTESITSEDLNAAFYEEPATLSTTSYLARFRPECLRDYPILPESNDDLLDSIAFFNLSRPLDAPQEWSEEERMEFMCIQMRMLWNITE